MLLLFTVLGCGPSEKHYDWRGKTMGTYYQVRVVSALPMDETHHQDLIAVMGETNSLMSNWLDSSEVSRFNEHRTTEPFPVSEATAAVVAAALDLHAKTRGALDPTISPLIELWGFGTHERLQFPEPGSIEEALARGGMQRLSISDNSLIKNLPELTVNLSAIAKGYAVDRVASRLEESGFTNYLVNIGGEVRVKGVNPQGDPWRMAVEKPNYEKGREVYGVFDLKDRAMATSGDYRIYFTHEGKQYSHIIDPRNGYPVTHGIASASVIADDCMTADGLATALLVLTPEEGLEVIEDLPGVECLILVRDGNGGYIEYASSGLAAYRLQ
ncbi:MAG: FAD:protein FMN transferase [Acidobacteriota bacterium]|nr:FAD:protein FMN transferase [Acidobacteriota bacterium]